jgi:hypothetical protein
LSLNYYSILTAIIVFSFHAITLKLLADVVFNAEPKKRLATEALVSRVKRQKVLGMGPSSLALSKNYERLQKSPQEKILDDRPEDDDIPPISLLYEGFGEFLDIVAGSTDCLHSINISMLESAVDEFADSICQFFENEDSRRKRGLQLINKIFSASNHHSPSITASSIGPVLPSRSAVRKDGHITGSHDVLIIATEFKNRSCGNSAIPEVELLGYFAHSFCSSTYLQDMNEDLKGWRVPALGFTIIGISGMFRHG